MANLGDRRPASQLPGYDGDWRDPRNMQVYADPMLQLENLLDNLLNLQEYVDRLRLLRSHKRAAGTRLRKSSAWYAFPLMMGLADDRLVSKADNVSFCDVIEKPVARACQAAMKVLDAYYTEKRLKVGPTYLAAARIVIQCVEVELLRHDLLQKKRELSALAKGKSIRLSPGTFNIVPDILARWRGLQIPGGKPFEGSRLDAVANRFNRDRSVLRESVDNAISRLQDKFGCYCNDLAIPPEKAIRPCYNCFEDGRNRRVDKPKPALQAVKLPDADFLGPWRTEALGYWGDATKLPQGLADGYLQPNISPAYRGAVDYESDPMLIWHPQLPADWRQLIQALPDGRQKTKLKDKDAEIERLVSDQKHRSESRDYFGGYHDWKSKAVPPARPNRRPPGIRSPYFCGPVIEIGDKLYPRAVGARQRVVVGGDAELDVGDVVDRIEITQNREDRFCFPESQDEPI